MNKQEPSMLVRLMPFRDVYTTRALIKCNEDSEEEYIDFIFDTGCGTSCIDQKILNKNSENFEILGERNRSTGGGKITEEMTSIHLINIGGVVLWREPVIGIDKFSFDDSFIAEDDSGVPVAGLLGMDFLDCFDFRFIDRMYLELVKKREFTRPGALFKLQYGGEPAKLLKAKSVKGF